MFEILVPTGPSAGNKAEGGSCARRHGDKHGMAVTGSSPAIPARQISRNRGIENRFERWADAASGLVRNSELPIFR
jgi:hypothetical protein